MTLTSSSSALGGRSPGSAGESQSRRWEDQAGGSGCGSSRARRSRRGRWAALGRRGRGQREEPGRRRGGRAGLYGRRPQQVTAGERAGLRAELQARARRDGGDAAGAPKSPKFCRNMAEESVRRSGAPSTSGCSR